MPTNGRKDLFRFMLARVKDVANISLLKEPQAFIRWFLTLYYDLPPGASVTISDGSGDGKVDGFAKRLDGTTTRDVLVNSKFTGTFDQIAPVKFYDEIIRFGRAFEDTSVREEYLQTVKKSFRDRYELFFERYDEGLADLVFVTNHRVNPKQVETVKSANVTVLHLDDLLQFMVENFEGAMPRTNDLILTDITNVLNPPKTDTGVATSLVFAKLTDFIAYMRNDPHDLLFSRNVRLNLQSTEVNKEIEDTFASSPDEFAFSNNGITMLCERHVHETGSARLSIQNPRVVNGAQTLHSVKSAKKKSDSARVMVRIIEIPAPRSSHFEADVEKRKEIIDKIALRTNRQNTIKKYDLVSNDEKQHEIAAYFRRHDLYYERRQREWKARKLELQSLGIRPGPTLKEMTQLAAAYLWNEFGPAKARSGVDSLFDRDNYERITRLSPRTYYRLYLIQESLLDAAKSVAMRTTVRNREMRKYVNFAMFSLFVKGMQQLAVDIETADALPFTDTDLRPQWENVATEIFKVIWLHFSTKVRRDRQEGTVTIANYTKNATYMADLLRAKIDPALKASIRSLVR
jgi:hypothetical protein